MARFKIFLGVVCAGGFVAGLFWAAGGYGWIRGWAYIGLLTLGQTLTAVTVWRTNPELINRRGEIGEGTKTWDFVLLGIFALTYLASVLVAALDERHGGSAMSPWLWFLGLLLYILFVVVITWAMVVNPHFEKTVRIQTDRDHRVIDSGPYRIVRHPGYLGTIPGLILATPLLLGSWWAFLPALLAGVSLVLRTALEDRTLRTELPGYEAYARKVRYRLLPGLW